jgi:hypothetical protein
MLSGTDAFNEISGIKDPQLNIEEPSVADAMEAFDPNQLEEEQALSTTYTLSVPEIDAIELDLNNDEISVAEFASQYTLTVPEIEPVELDLNVIETSAQIIEPVSKELQDLEASFANQLNSNGARLSGAAAEARLHTLRSEGGSLAGGYDNDDDDPNSQKSIAQRAMQNTLSSITGYNSTSTWIDTKIENLDQRISAAQFGLDEVNGRIVLQEDDIRNTQDEITKQEAAMPALEEKVEELTEEHGAALEVAQEKDQELQTATRELTEAEVALQDADKNAPTGVLSGDKMFRDDEGNLYKVDENGEQAEVGWIESMAHGTLSTFGLANDAQNVDELKDNVASCQGSCEIAKTEFAAASATEEELAEKLTLAEHELSVADEHLTELNEQLDLQVEQLEALQAEKGGYEEELKVAREQRAEMETLKQDFHSDEVQQKLASGEITLEDYMKENLSEDLHNDYQTHRTENPHDFDNPEADGHHHEHAHEHTHTTAAPAATATTTFEQTENVVATATAAAGSSGMTASVNMSNQFAAATGINGTPTPDTSAPAPVNQAPVEQEFARQQFQNNGGMQIA